jgi:hypothetical protein
MDILLSFRSFLIAFLAYFKYRIISSANTDNLTSSFPVNIPCIYFPCLLGLAKDSSTIWNKSEKSGPPCLIPDIRRSAFNFLSFSTRLAIYYVGLYYVYPWSFYSLFLQGFYYKGIHSFVKDFFYIYWDDHVSSVLFSIYVLYCVYWFVFVESYLHL